MFEPQDCEEILNRARMHADNLARDIKNATTRLEHVRLTQLAFEANRLVELLEELFQRRVENV